MLVAVFIVFIEFIGFGQQFKSVSLSVSASAADFDPDPDFDFEVSLWSFILKIFRLLSGSIRNTYFAT